LKNFALLFYNINWFTNPENGRPWIALVCRKILNKEQKTKEIEGGTLIITFNVRNLTSSMQETSFRITNARGKWKRRQRR
jgi:hypothetical protein